MTREKFLISLALLLVVLLVTAGLIFAFNRPLFTRIVKRSEQGTVAGTRTPLFPAPSTPRATNTSVNAALENQGENAETQTALDRGVPNTTSVDSPPAIKWTTEELQNLAKRYGAVGNRQVKFTKDQIAIMKAANPDLVVQRYMNIASGYNVVPDAYRKAHPELLLKTASGELHHGLTIKNNELIFDPGNETWRKIFIDIAVKAVTEEGHDGITVDETAIVNRLFEPFTGINPRTNQPFTTEEWRDEVYEFLGELKTALGPDKMIILNSVAYGDVYFKEGAERFLAVSTGFSAEGFKGPITWDTTRYPSEALWLKNVEMVTSVQEKGGTIVAIAKYDIALITSQEDLDAHGLFTWLTFMLGKGDTSAYSHNEYDKKDPFSPHLPYPWYWEVDYGQPLGPYTKVGSVYMRDFEQVKILVNPGTLEQIVDLGGTYTTLDGQTVTSVTMEPHRGLIVRRP